MNTYTFEINGKSYSNFTTKNIDSLVSNKEITQQQANVIMFTGSVNQKLDEINQACQSEFKALTDTYPAGEVSTFDKQETEARAYLNDNAALTPLLDALSLARGMDKAELVNRVIAKADVFSQASGAIIGKRQRLEDDLYALSVDTHTIEDVNAIQW